MNCAIKYTSTRNSGHVFGSKVERSETGRELRALFLAKFMPDLRFLDGFGTGSTGATQKTCLKLNRKCRTRDIPQWHFSPAVFLASKTTQIKNRVKIRVKWGHTVS